METNFDQNLEMEIAATWKCRLVSIWKNFGLETGDFSLELKWGPILAQNSEIETGGE
ncbi:hypothetical protein RhiirA5_407077 [Rhizophagus irregularis]|uniref:Uncharacterized protein n=1 Tax=Rhizophagus irregularis TaxID=588596 RepID=A0A2N0S4D5_9GLOM|nr:hypothetical protein RhiirA5_407077 [Rhizophagus irregularis]PKC70421.1 hypothetical protein RhiirA1_454828 [Rhizophagus irregularis]